MTWHKTKHDWLLYLSVIWPLGRALASESYHRFQTFSRQSEGLATWDYLHSREGICGLAKKEFTVNYCKFTFHLRCKCNKDYIINCWECIPYVTVHKLIICQTTVIFCKSVPVTEGFVWADPLQLCRLCSIDSFQSRDRLEGNISIINSATKRCKNT